MAKLQNIDSPIEAEEGSGDDGDGDDDGGDTAAEEEDVLNAMDYNIEGGWEEDEEENGKGFLFLSFYVHCTKLKA